MTTPGGDGGDDAFRRWLRRKSQAAVESDQATTQERVPEPDAPAVDSPRDALDPADARVGASSITDEDLPPLSQLDEDSDYSMFLASGVSPSRRREALRQLFRSRKFNVKDGLDDYCEDLTSFAPLGDVVTAEMRRRAERAVGRALDADEVLADTGDGAPSGPACGEQPVREAKHREADSDPAGNDDCACKDERAADDRRDV